MILLDTHVVYWAGVEPRRLSRDAARAVEQEGRSGALSISAITLFELANLAHKGRIRLPGSLAGGIDTLLKSTGVLIHEITPEIAVVATEFQSPFPADPMDRLIAATARVLNLALVTKDALLLDSPLLRTIW